MARPHSTRYTVAALLLLGIAVVILASLGQWQLRRSDERRAILAAIEAGRKQAPVQLTPATPSDSLVPWRVAQATGTWLPQFSVLLDNRNHDGRPGYWLATPLLLDSASRQAVLVLRGWLPRVIQGQGEPVLPATPEGPQTVTGELSERVPRMFELWSLGGQDQSALPALPAADGKTPQVQNLPLDTYARATGLNLLPVVLSQTSLPSDASQPSQPNQPSQTSQTSQPGQTSPASADGLIRDWPEPPVDFQKNTSYAVQWFAFASIAAIAWLVVLGGAIKRMRQRAEPGPGPDRAHQ
ncbi:MAG: SURF1 family protein [Achromobacter kerstersii]|uniref:SURF1 family protein n=1 Tax=Achromobacter kerstersii TaxID=1353890 RepID=UPI003CFE7E9F